MTLWITKLTSNIKWQPSPISANQSKKRGKRAPSHLSLQSSFPFSSYTASSASLWSSNSYGQKWVRLPSDLTYITVVFPQCSPQIQSHFSGWSLGCAHSLWRTSPRLFPEHVDSDDQWTHGIHSWCDPKVSWEKRPHVMVCSRHSRYLDITNNDNT